MRPSRVLSVVMAGLIVALPGSLPPAEAETTSVPVAPRVTTVVAGLEVPWDVAWIGTTMLYDERPGRVWSLRPGGAPVRVNLPLPPIFQGSEAGLLGLVADPHAVDNRLFYTCQSVARADGSASDVQVWKWRLVNDARAAKVAVLVKGIPIGYGRHNGCRLRFRSDRMLYIGTGDAAHGTNPQSLNSLGGKVLRVRSDGSIPRSNPFYAKGGNARYVWNYGHRNVQGLALRPGTNQLWTAEHGTDRDDEVNVVLRGRNYGWAPTPGYDESRPMTDTKRFPKAVTARWRSGFPTVATSGATFLSGRRWGSWNGLLAVAELKGSGILLFRVGASDRLSQVDRIATGYGRIRTVAQGPDGALYFTTSNGSGDAIYRLVTG